MITIHYFAYNLGGVMAATYAVYVTPANSDLGQLIHDASLDFCRAKRDNGREVPELTYAQFALCVPNEFCERHGFTKILTKDVATPYDGNSICLSRFEINRYLKDMDANNQWKKRLCQTYASFARHMSPSMRKGTAIDDWTFLHIAKEMLSLSMECADGMGGLDIEGHPERDFVRRALEQLKEVKKLGPPAEAVEQNPEQGPEQN